MDFQNNKRNQPNASGTSHFTESNAGHISVKTTSPFLNKMKDSEFAVSEQTHNKSKKNHSFVASMLSKKAPKDIASGTSKMLINQILGDNNIDRDAILLMNKTHIENSRQSEKQCNYNQNFLLNDVELQYSTPTFNSKSFSMQQGSCSGEDSIDPSKSSVNENTRGCIQINTDIDSKTTVKEKQYAEKTTYCRPARNYNLEFINKTVERNNRLQRLVKKLIDARKKEKQTEAWNNYINELKNKHGYGDSDHNGLIGRYTLDEPTSPAYIDDYYNDDFISKPSSRCKDLLQDFYEAYYTLQEPSNSVNPYTTLPSQNYRSYFNHSNCYPMSSQGRLMMLNRERRKNAFAHEWKNLPASRPFHGNTIYVDREPKRLRPNVKSLNRLTQTKHRIGDPHTHPPHTAQLNSSYIQTDNDIVTSDSCNPSTSSNKYGDIETKQKTGEENMKDSYTLVSENVDRLKKKIQDTCNINASEIQQTVLRSIESKLDTLLTSINSFIDEVKSRAYNRCYDCQSVCVSSVNNKKVTNKSKSDTLGIVNKDQISKAERIVCGVSPEKIIPIIKVDKHFLDIMSSTSTDKIELKKNKSSDISKDHFEKLFTPQVGHCSVQIAIEIPTKERSTEVTDSLSKAILQLEDKSVSIEEIERDDSAGERCMTIAVNTDPLGILALLRVSTETVKQILSYVPNIPYQNYLPIINFPQRRNDVNHFVCNICGAAYVKPSQLSDHIQTQHSLGMSRFVDTSVSLVDSFEFCFTAN